MPVGASMTWVPSGSVSPVWTTLVAGGICARPVTGIPRQQHGCRGGGPVGRVLARLWSTIRRRSDGTQSGSGGGGSLTCARAVATAEPESKGLRPVSISWVMMPSAYRSLAPVSLPAERLLGREVLRVPRTSPVRVCDAPSVARAMPKSVSFTRPSGVMRMLAGLTSR